MSIPQVQVDESELSEYQLYLKDVQIRPTIIKEVDGERIEVTPVYTETVRVTTQNDNRKHRSLCGQSHIERIGEGEYHATLEGQIVKSQLQQLKRMRPADGEVKLLTEGYEGYVEFDRFTYGQDDEENMGEFEHGNRTIREPIFNFQLQTDEGNN